MSYIVYEAVGHLCRVKHDVLIIADAYRTKVSFIIS